MYSSLIKFTVALYCFVWISWNKNESLKLCKNVPIAFLSLKVKIISMNINSLCSDILSYIQDDNSSFRPSWNDIAVECIEIVPPLTRRIVKDISFLGKDLYMFMLLNLTSMINNFTKLKLYTKHVYLSSVKNRNIDQSDIGLDDLNIKSDLKIHGQVHPPLYTWSWPSRMNLSFSFRGCQ